MRWQMESLYRVFDLPVDERRKASKQLNDSAKKVVPIRRLCTIPGVGPRVACTLAGWIAEPGRFKSRSALASYAGRGPGHSEDSHGSMDEGNRLR
jgi:transposase